LTGSVVPTTAVISHRSVLPGVKTSELHAIKIHTVARTNVIQTLDSVLHLVSRTELFATITTIVVLTGVTELPVVVRERASESDFIVPETANVVLSSVIITLAKSVAEEPERLVLLSKIVATKLVLMDIVIFRQS